MPGKTVIYEPPEEGLPYLVVTFASDGLNVLTAKILRLGRERRYPSERYDADESERVMN